MRASLPTTSRTGWLLACLSSSFVHPGLGPSGTAPPMTTFRGQGVSQGRAGVVPRAARDSLQVAGQDRLGALDGQPCTGWPRGWRFPTLNE